MLKKSKKNIILKKIYSKTILSERSISKNKISPLKSQKSFAKSPMIQTSIKNRKRRVNTNNKLFNKSKTVLYT
jgi:hypothetical protein